MRKRLCDWPSRRVHYGGNLAARALPDIEGVRAQIATALSQGNANVAEELAD